MKDLSDGSKSLYLDIYRNGKRTYEYLKLYLIPGTDNNTRRQNEITMAAANAIKSKRIIELTSGEAGIVNHTDKVYLLDWMQTYLEYQEKRDKKGIGQIKAVTHILKEYAGERFCWIGLTSLLPRLYRLHADDLPPQRKADSSIYTQYLLSDIQRCPERCRPG